MDITSDLERKFEAVFGGRPRIYCAPGRVNLIGEHTDYNDGYVMPAAIGLYCWIAIVPRNDHKLRLHSLNFDQTITVNLDDPHLAARGDWSDYVVGTAQALRHAGHALHGADVVIRGEVPLGSGLSSSAAIEVSTGYALLDVSGISIEPADLAVACRRAENEFVGARVGIMDQFISANGKANHALMLDCRSLSFRTLPLPKDIRLVVCNTGVKHEIAGGEYNLRRAQCEEGVRKLQAVLPGITALRDVSPADLERHKHLLPDLIYRRCRHVVTEDDRVLKAAEALTSNDLARFGHLMSESHRSLRDDYEVSCAELDLMVEIASRQPGAVGARMTGGGFGGCTVNLVHEHAAEAFKTAVAAEYQQRTGIHADVFVLTAAGGAHAVQARGAGSNS